MSGVLSQKKVNVMESEIKLGPTIDEKADFTVIEVDGYQVLNFDLSGLTHINSTGIKLWMQWLNQNLASHPGMLYNFSKCPKVFIDQANMVEGFLPENSKVYSLAVPYFCEKCNKEGTVTFSAGKEYQFENGQWQVFQPDLTCEKSQCEYEPDVADRYFRFLHKMNE